MNIKKKLFLLAFIVLSSSSFAQRLKDRSYYVENYQYSGAAGNNVGLIYSNDREFMAAIENGFIDVNYKYDRGRTLLYKALLEYQYKPEIFIRIADFLVKNGADVNIADDDGDTPLLSAVDNYNDYHTDGKLDTRIIDFLLKNKADVKVKNNMGITILFYLCKRKKTEIDLVKRFIKLGAPLNTPSDYSYSPLTYALENKNIELARVLIESGADVNLKDNCETCPLNSACDIGDLNFVKFMISKGADVNVKGRDDYTPLHYAVESGSKDSLELVKLLVDNGADVNAATKNGYTPLIFAGWEKNSFELIKYLVSKKADVNAKTNDGYNVGMSCARQLDLECYKFLEKNKFDFKSVDKNGDTVLQYFTAVVTCENREQLLYYSKVMEKEAEIAEIIAFLAKKCGINRKNKYNTTPLHTACRSIIDYTKIIEPLIKNGADVNAKTDFGWTPIFYCGERPKMVQLLVDSGADLSVKDKYGKTYLDRCEEALKNNPNMSEVVEILKANSKTKKKYSFVQLCEYNYTDKALEMLKKGNVKDFDDYDENGYTPLYYAVINKNLELTKTLLDKGCDINRLHQKKETTVLWYAVDTGNVEMVKLLLKYNPDFSIKSKDKFYDRKSNILGTGIDASTNNGRKQKYEIVKLLLEAGCNPNATIESDDKNYTITASCCMHGDEDLIELLIEYGGNPFAVWEAWLWNHKYSFSIIRKDIYNEGINYDRKKAVYRGLVKYYKNKSLVATDNLRIRNGYSRSDGTITAIKKGTKVKVLNADNMEIIDDIHSCWVEVEVLPGSVDSNGRAIPKGTKGWCFLGYLASE